MQKHQTFIASFWAVLIVLLILCPSGLYQNDINNYDLLSISGGAPSSSGADSSHFILRNSNGDTEFLRFNNSVSKRIEVSTVDRSEVSKTYFRYALTNNHAVLNGGLLAVSANSGQIFESLDGSKFRKQNKDRNDSSFNFLNDSQAPPQSALLPGKINLNEISRTASNLKSSRDMQTSSDISALVYSSGLREIEFYAVLPEDFSEGYSEEELLAQVLRVTFNANQYLKDINLVLVPVGVKIYRGSSRFTQALQARDPYEMLGAGVDERREMGVANSDLLTVFSKTYFSRATGLAYQTTACENPMYSVLFASGGALNAAYELTLSAVLAHETGHYLGISHDDSHYSSGFSLMSSRQVSMPFGFSVRSKEEQNGYSGLGQVGGSCLSSRSNELDSDFDGVPNADEIVHGTDPNDSGSFYNKQSGKFFIGWNRFASQEMVGEIANSADRINLLSLKFHDPSGQEISSMSLTLNPKVEFDLLFSDILKDHKNSYGLVEINSLEPIHGRGSIYSFEKNFENFNFVNQQAIFRGVKGKPLFIPFNSIVPNTLPQGSSVANWLSVVNTGNVGSTIRVRTFSPGGFLTKERILFLNPKSRQDISGGSESDKSGIHQIEILNSQNSTLPYSEIGFNAFLNRYYVDPSGNIVASALAEGEFPNGAKRYFVHNAGPRLKTFGQTPVDAWIEVANSLIVSNSVKVKAEMESGEVIFDKMLELSPLSGTHIQLPFLNRNYIVTIESLKPEGLTIFGAKYVNEFGIQSVEALKFQEEMQVEKYASVNSFINTSSNLILTNSNKKKGTLTCRISESSRTLERTVELTANAFEIHSIAEMFPEFGNNRYATISCLAKEPNGTIIPASYRIDRFIEGRHVLETIFR